jgi:hypothetical protein
MDSVRGIRDSLPQTVNMCVCVCSVLCRSFFMHVVLIVVPSVSNKAPLYKVWKPQYLRKLLKLVVSKSYFCFMIVLYFYAVNDIT